MKKKRKKNWRPTNGKKPFLLTRVRPIPLASVLSRNVVHNFEVHHHLLYRTSCLHRPTPPPFHPTSRCHIRRRCCRDSCCGLLVAHSLFQGLMWRAPLRPANLGRPKSRSLSMTSLSRSRVSDPTPSSHQCFTAFWFATQRFTSVILTTN